MEITLYKNSDDPRVMSKTLTEPITLQAEIKEQCSTDTPAFYIKYNSDILTEHYNYASAWGRYYFLGEPELVPGQGMILRGKQDSLMTYAAQIRACPAVIRRNSGVPNTYLPDSSLPLTAYKNQQILTFEPFTYFDQCIIVCVG